MPARSRRYAIRCTEVPENVTEFQAKYISNAPERYVFTVFWFDMQFFVLKVPESVPVEFRATLLKCTREIRLYVFWFDMQFFVLKFPESVPVEFWAKLLKCTREIRLYIFWFDMQFFVLKFPESVPVEFREKLLKCTREMMCPAHSFLKMFDIVVMMAFGYVQIAR